MRNVFDELIRIGSEVDGKSVFLSNCRRVGKDFD
jgi:hypothetical protein